jgi:hypothetical protein
MGQRLFSQLVSSLVPRLGVGVVLRLSGRVWTSYLSCPKSKSEIASFQG